MRIALLTREFPPEVYGGAGVHVEHLARELSRRGQIGVHCFGAAREDPVVAASYEPWPALDGAEPHLSALRTMSVDLLMTAGVAGADLVHSHTWYANLAGHLAKLVHGVPHVATTHSLEPLRPWKAEQLGGGYALSSFCERTGLEGADAIIAVSEQMRSDVLVSYPAVTPERVHVIHNGIDTERYAPVDDPSVLERHGVDGSRPIVLFVGRITRQKGLVHLLEAARALHPDAQLVLCAGAPDTPELLSEVRGVVDELHSTRTGVVWVEAVLDRADVVALMSAATVFVCPSVYEPFGLVNVEAMACEAAVVATAVGGIPEVVVDGETGFLVPPADPGALAQRINALVADPDLAATFGRAGRARAVEHFSWPTVTDETIALYRSLL